MLKKEYPFGAIFSSTGGDALSRSIFLGGLGVPYLSKFCVACGNTGKSEVVVWFVKDRSRD